MARLFDEINRLHASDPGHAGRPGERGGSAPGKGGSDSGMTMRDAVGLKGFESIGIKKAKFPMTDSYEAFVQQPKGSDQTGYALQKDGKWYFYDTYGEFRKSGTGLDSLKQHLGISKEDEDAWNEMRSRLKKIRSKP